ncbi:hypothetical protein OUZ56_033884 [Daphnia magna]|uniref:Uncharacterized protein n=1 Tax=Daphnia magna TaxID=35525 RepID=A0ABR0BB85_9CRUS|nr:hypothetical protein OUZ56_026403 [Daphnia magna]KAK4045838.1 hypothetical protein OUZ56_033884 [Daphnia magna]
MDYLGNNKWSFERIPKVQSTWLQVTADQLINCPLEEVTLETECANCTISLPIGDIPGGINGSVSHNLVTIVWKESLREVQQCKLRLVETDIENIADIIRAEISGAVHSQYARDRTTDGINGVARETRALQWENQVLKHKIAIATTQHSGWLAANYVNLPTCCKLIATGASINAP